MARALHSAASHGPSSPGPRFARWLAVSVWLGGAWLAAGCSWLGADVDELFDGPECATPDCTDGGLADAGQDADAEPVCDPIKPPSRPSGPNGTGPDRAYVLRDIVLDQSLDRWQSLGFDLDDRCSIGADPDVECLPPGGGAPETDGLRGIDNAFGHRVAPSLVSFDSQLQSRIRADQLSGRGGVLLHLAGYDGTANDPSVDVFIAQTIFAIPAGASVPDEPSWDGRDRWYLEDSAFDGDASRPLVRNDNAYVRDWRLVVRLPDRTDITFNVGDGTVEFRLISATIVGELTPDGTELRDVVLSGRWALSDVAIAATQLGLCPGSVERGLLDSALSNIADVRATPGTGGPGARCDAVSLSLGFTGYRGEFAGLALTEDPPVQCD